jgi:two-component system response regulator NreC
MTVRILMVDDHGLLRASLRALLDAEPDLHVVGEAADGNEALERVRDLCPDIVLLNVSLTGLDGMRATRGLAEMPSSPRVLMVTVHEDESLLWQSIQAGAVGYLVKRADRTELVAAIRAISRGDLYVHPAITRALPRLQQAPTSPVVFDIDHLTPREVEVLRYIAQGYTNRQIAEEWTISVRTVESHRASIMAKLNLHSRADLVRYARERGLL